MHHLSRKMALAAIIMLCGGWIHAQQTISGIVTDVNGTPVIGAGVVVEGTQNGTVTGVDGDYTLSVPENATIVVSCIGYADRTAVVTAGNTTYNLVTWTFWVIKWVEKIKGGHFG